MKNVTHVFLVATLICLTIACSKEERGLDSTPFLSLDEFNQKFQAGELGTSEHNAVVILAYDEEGNLISNERYQKEVKEYSENWERRFAPLSAFEALDFDNFDPVNYIRTVPMGSESAMYIYDAYEIPSKKLTTKEENARINAIFSKINEKDVVCSLSQLTSGDVFFEYGWYWGNTCSGAGQGGSKYGRLSMVHSVKYQHSERLGAIEISEASYAVDPNNVHAYTPGTVIKTFADQVYEPNKPCSNYWNAVKMRDLMHTKADGNQIYATTACLYYYEEEKGKPYAFNYKNYGYSRPSSYYTSLYVWEAYQEITGKDLDVNGGTVVSPNDFVLGAFPEANWNTTDPWFEICDF